MKKIFSLKNKREFNRTIKDGKKIFSNSVNLFYLPNDGTLIGITVPKKLGNAVYRNKQKRIIKNILDNQEIYKNLDLKIIIIVKKNFENKNYLEIEKEIISLFKKVEKKENG